MERGGYHSNGTAAVKGKQADNVFRARIWQTLGATRLDLRDRYWDFSQHTNGSIALKTPLVHINLSPLFHQDLRLWYFPYVTPKIVGTRAVVSIRG